MRYFTDKVLFKVSGDEFSRLKQYIGAVWFKYSLLQTSSSGWLAVKVNKDRQERKLPYSNKYSKKNQKPSEVHMV